MHRFVAVLFDLDGTILDSKPLIRESFVHSWKQVMGTRPPVERFMPLVGLPLRTMLSEMVLMETGKEDTAKVDLMLAEYGKSMEENERSILKPFDGCFDTIKSLRALGVRIALVTSKRRDVSVRHLKIFDAVPLFDAMVFAEDTLRHKPDPQPFQCAASRLGVSPGCCLAVGDSPADLFSSRNAGMLFAAAMWGADPKEALLGAGPDYVLLHPRDILQLFQAVR